MKRKGIGRAVAIIGMVLQGVAVVQTVYALWVTWYQLSPAGVLLGDAQIATTIAEINRPFWKVLVVAVVCLLLSVLLFRKGRYWLVAIITALPLIAQYLLTDALRN